MSYTSARTVSEVEALAAKLGRRVVYPKPNELQIDIDSADAYANHLRLLDAFERGGETVIDKVVSVSPSAKSGHFHVTITLARNVLGSRERVMLQALLGSDPMRELLSYQRVEAGSPAQAVSVFFELPEVVR